MSSTSIPSISSSSISSFSSPTSISPASSALMSEGSLGGRPCGVGGCKKNATEKCSGCLVKFYCGRECQRTNWKEHKKVCNIPTHKVKASRGSSDRKQLGLLDNILRSRSSASVLPTTPLEKFISEEDIPWEIRSTQCRIIPDVYIIRDSIDKEVEKK